MHEIGYVESLLPVLETRAEGRTVTGIGVRAGVLHRLVDSSFQQAFEMVTAGTIAEAAAVELEQIPVDVTCRVCDDVSTADQQLALCPRCGSTEVVNANGDEFTLHWVAFAEQPDTRDLPESSSARAAAVEVPTWRPTSTDSSSPPPSST